MKNYLLVRLNAMQLSSAASFSGIKGGFNGGRKDVYFLRLIGYDSESRYLEEISKMDAHLAAAEKQRSGGYVRVGGLPLISEREDVEYYIKQYESWLRADQQCGTIRYEFGNDLLQNTYWNALSGILQLYKQYDSNASESIIKNFIVKAMFWSDFFLPRLYRDWNERLSPKFVFNGKLKKHEYLFLYLLTQLGTDVLYMNSEEEPSIEKELLDYSAAIRLPLTGRIPVPEYDVSQAVNFRPEVPEHNEKKEKNHPSGIQKEKAEAPRPVNRKRPEGGKGTNSDRLPVRSDRELNYEELAKLASSVVMIQVCDSHGKCFKTGSGIMVSNRGYILTNHHVACDGAYYSVRLEDDEEIYHSDEMIKYNYYQDLALIRIDRDCRPLPVYGGNKPLVRGQKVVAIGSPLGLFNSVSEGIISGFREIDDVTMIQFTAPTSHGSSGGALLNMYGEIIGISTSGMDEGQNINLAVDYEAIAVFVKGFIYA